MTDPRERATLALEHLATATPGAIRLARVVSLAARIEPELLRKARLRLLPQVDAGAEADLWLGPLAASKTSLAMTLDPEVSEILRSQLAADPVLLEAARAVLREVHVQAPPAIVLQEEVTYLALKGDTSRIHELLLSAVAAMVVQDRRGVARWAIRAIPRLPQAAIATEAAQMLVAGAQARLGLAPDVGEGAGEWLSLVLPDQVPRAEIGVRMVDQGLEIGDSSLLHSHRIQVPWTNPLLIEVSWQERFQHGAGIRALDLSQDGRYLVTGGDDGIVRLWDVRTGREEGSLPCQGPVATAQFSPDGSYLVAGGGKARVWDMARQEPVLPEIDLASPGGVAWSPTGQLLAAAPPTQGVQLWDVAAGTIVGSFGGPGQVRRIAFHPGGEMLATADWAGAVRMWNVPAVAEGEPKTLTDVSQSTPVETLAFDSSGHRLAIGGEDGAVGLWDLATGKEMFGLMSQGVIRTGAVSPDGRLLAATGDDGTIRVHHAESGTGPSLVGERLSVRALAFSPDGRYLAIGEGDGCQVRRTSDWAQQIRLSGMGEASVIAMSQDSSLAAAGGESGTVGLIDLERGMEVVPGRNAEVRLNQPAVPQLLPLHAAKVRLRTGLGESYQLRKDPHPLGATVSDGGTNFAVASGIADGMVLCLFDKSGAETQIPMRDYDDGIWHTFVPGVGAGQAYGYRAVGPYDPARGLRCNPAKLLLDPYARAFSGTVTFGPEVLGHSAGDPDAPNDADSAASVPRSLVVDDRSRWTDTAPMRRPYSDTIIYEVHVKGFTMRHPGVPAELRGTYAGLGHDAAIAHLLDLGVTAVELLPVHESIPESYLVQRGLTNYWGYNTIGYFAPHQAYSAAVRAGQPGGQVAEFKAMVNALHAAGLEVILDVVFNHTCEGSDTGPTFCFRGLDNPAYYRLAEDPRYYVDTTGCGNSLNVGDPVTLQLIMDSLRYWLTEMHVDGFRFDLAPALVGQAGALDKVSAFLDMVSQDPVVSRAKLVAEPWDVGQMDTYDLGGFPPVWRELNGRYRDTMRDFWRSHPVGLGEFATRFCGSSDMYGRAGGGPTASVNLITVHDGFTLRDLVSYDGKHNEANGESNRDGTDDNRSWNCGVEGPTDDPDVLGLRARQSRAMLATLLLSFGIPMLLGGDEMGRTQQGNNNAYCQDNEITWFDWSQPDTGLLEFTRRLIAFRKAHPAFRRAGAEASELRWFTPPGTEMTGADWWDPNALAIALYLDGSDDPDRAADGTWLVDDDFMVLVNAWWEPLDFTLPITRPQARWQAEIDTYEPAAPVRSEVSNLEADDHITVGPRSVRILLNPRPSG